MKYADISHIYQAYAEGWRYRSSLNQGTNKFNFEKLKKVKVGTGINHEIDVEQITYEQFTEGTNKRDRSITKDRYTIEYKGKKFEVDYFYKMSLVVCEVEDVDMDTVIEFPPEIEKLILLEVTGNPNFDNFNLAS